MKTVAFNRNRGVNWTAFGLLAGLIGFYFYRRQGGSVSELWNRSSRSVNAARDYLRKGMSSSSGQADQSIPVERRVPENA